MPAVKGLTSRCLDYTFDYILRGCAGKLLSMRSADVDFGSIPFSCTTNEQTVCEADNKAPRVRVYAFIARENQATLEGGFYMKNYLKRFVTAASLPKFEAEYSV